MAIITNLTKIVEELTAQKLAPAGKEYPTLDALIEAVDPDILQEIEAQPEEDEDLFDEGFVEMMPCDFSGYCAGTNCPNFFKCKGSTK